MNKSLFIFIIGFKISLALALNVVYAADQQTEELETNEHQYNKDIDKVIKEGLDECSSLKNDNCIAVMSALDNICQVAYFPNCFGDNWTSFMQYLSVLIKEGHYPDEKYKEDPYLTLNNHHFGNESWDNHQ